MPRIVAFRLVLSWNAVPPEAAEPNWSPAISKLYGTTLQIPLATTLIFWPLTALVSVMPAIFLLFCVVHFLTALSPNISTSTPIVKRSSAAMKVLMKRSAISGVVPSNGHVDKVFHPTSFP